MSAPTLPPALPPGSVLVHIGPYKTGSTALQMALHQDRAALAELGVVYPGPKHRVMEPGWALLGRSAAGAAAVDIAVWDAFATEIRAAAKDGARVCLSTEDFASLGPQQLQKLVTDLGTDRVRLLLVARRLDRLLPSAWQERVKSWNETRTYDEFLHDVLGEGSTSRVATTFWRNHGVDAQLSRWTAVLPADRITLIVADEADRTRTASVVEALLGIPSGTLRPAPVPNSSLAYERVELFRRVNVLAKEQSLPPRLRRALLYLGLKDGLRAAPATPGNLSIPLLPGWAAERVSMLSERRASEVRSAAAQGVRVVGDPGLLRVDASDVTVNRAAMPSQIDLDTAAHAVMGVVAAVVRREKAPAPRPSAANPPVTLDAFGGRDLARELARRIRRRVTRRP